MQVTLAAFLQAASQALAATGSLVFTLEKYEGEQGFKLNYHGSYAHTPHYVSDCLSNAGFDIRTLKTVILRKEAGEPVVGILVTATLRSMFKTPNHI